MSDSGWTEELAAEHNDKYEREVERLREVGKQFMSEQERFRAAKGFVGALSEIAGLPVSPPADRATAGGLTDPIKSRKPRAHPERDLQESCEALLQLDGWRIFRMEQNYSERKKKVVGEPGVPDTMAVRYTWSRLAENAIQFTRPAEVPELHALTHVMHIEWKSATGKSTKHQRLWHAAERARGALTLIGGVDFPATVDGFLEWYRRSGLMRRKL